MVSGLITSVLACFGRSELWRNWRKNEATANEYSHPLMWSTHKKQWFNIFGIVSGALKKGDGISKMYLPHLFTGFWEETSFNSLAKKKTLSNSENNFRRGPCCNIGGLRKNPYSRTFRSTPIYKRGGPMLLNVFMYIHTGQIPEDLIIYRVKPIVSIVSQSGSHRIVWWTKTCEYGIPK